MSRFRDGSQNPAPANPKGETIEHTEIMSLLYFAYRDFDASVTTTGKRTVVSPLSVELLGGRVRAEGVYDLGDDEPEFNFQATVHAVEIGDLVADGVDGDARYIQGKLDGKITLAGSGSEWDDIQKELVGGGTMELRNGVIKDVNLADHLLAAITGVPGLSHLLSPQLRRKYPQMFSTGETTFETFGGELRVAQGRINTDDLAIDGGDFLVFGRGSVGFDRSVDVTATFEASEKFTRDLISDASVARYLVGPSQRLQIPFRIHGDYPGLVPQPDMRFVETALKRALTDKLADTILKGGRSRDGESPAPEGTRGSQPDPVEDLLQKGLEGLFGK